jgi:hypothetical protein
MTAGAPSLFVFRRDGGSFVVLKPALLADMLGLELELELELVRRAVLLALSTQLVVVLFEYTEPMHVLL